MVIVELIDFDEFLLESSSYHHNIQHLLNLLKLTIRKGCRRTKYSLQFEFIGELISVDHNYDIVISDKYNILISTQGTFIVIYNSIQSDQVPIPEKVLYQVNFNISLKRLKLRRENDNEYIYVTTSGNTIMKINLCQLLNTGEQSLIWQSEKFKSLKGIDIFNGRVYAMDYKDYTKPIKVLDFQSGKQLIEHFNLPLISNGFQINFISSMEVIINHNRCVELFHLNEDKWESVKKTTSTMVCAYSMYYERESQLIYCFDGEGGDGERIKVIDSRELSLVKSFGDFNVYFGMCIDSRSGLLYVCDPSKFFINVYKFL